MQTLILALHIIACLVLIVVVLLQSGKEGMGVIFGGGSSSLFGSSGAGGLLAKVTAVVAGIFLATSLGYNVITSPTKVESSVMDEAPVQSQPLDFEHMGNATEQNQSAAEPAAQPSEDKAADEQPAPANEDTGVTAPEQPAQQGNATE
ncbi:preprotein translocase subunit SecG [Oceanidesulfovibrio marinus]|uniref:Protein-export membrane protein SecG n=1 Tax=Oceanidesulfovibrio marinus TaxID=370038 RepID=A0ABX6NBZ1_9BACT|nr:preprotein translocase subunit SecG [Oceanidesulfovibrio marinus]QJT08116.1 preprotein translocase subunit SecG [Oceanidesulfovibrio marinus]